MTDPKNTKAYLQDLASSSVNDEKKARISALLFSLTNDGDCRKEIITLGGISTLMKLLDNSSIQVVKNSCGALVNLSNEAEARSEIRENNGAEKFLKFMREDKGLLREYAVGVFINLAHDEKVREYVKSSKGISVFANCLTSKDNVETLRGAIGSLGSLVMDPEMCEQLRQEKGSYDHIVSILRDFKDDHDLLIRTTGCCWNLCVDGMESQNALIQAGIVEPAFEILKANSGNLGTDALGIEERELLVNTFMILSILGEHSEEVSKKLREGDIFSIICTKGLKHPLESDEGTMARTSASALWNLGHQSENITCMKDFGVVPGLSALLSYPGDEELLLSSLGAVVTIGANEKIAIECREVGLLKKLIPLIENPKREKVCLYAIIALAVLAYEDGNKNAIREEGALAPILDLLTAKGATEPHIEKALAALLNLSLNQQNQAAVRQLDGLPPLIELLYHWNPVIQQNAAGVLWNLSNDPKNKKLIRELGGLGALLKMIGDGKLEPKKDVHIQRINEGRKDEPDEDDTSGDSSLSPDQLREDLKSYIQGARDKMDELPDNERKIVDEETKKMQEWLRSNPNASLAELKVKQNELSKKLDPILGKQDALQSLNDTIRSLKKRVDDDPEGKVLSAKEKKDIMDAVNASLDWLEKHPNPSSKEEIDKQRELLLKKTDPIVSRATAADGLNGYARDMQTKLKEVGDSLNPEEKKKVANTLQDALNWLRENPNASADKIQQKRRELEKSIEPLLSRAAAEKNLTKHANDLQKRLEDEKDCLYHLPPKDKKIVFQAAEDLVKWTKGNPNATMDQIDKRRKEFDKVVDPIVSYADQKEAYMKYIQGIRETLKPVALSTEEKKLVETKLKEIPESANYGADDFRKKREELRSVIDPIISNAKARGEFGDYAKSIKEKVKGDQSLGAQDVADIHKATDAALNFLRDKPSADVNDVLLEKQKLDNNVNQVMDKAKERMAEKNKLENLTKNIFTQLDNSQQLKDLQDDKKKAIRDIATDAQKWLSANPNASDKQVRDYMHTVYKLLGQQTNYKFQVWVVHSFGLGFGFKEYSKASTSSSSSQSGMTPSGAFYYGGGSYLQQEERRRQMEREKRQQPQADSSSLSSSQQEVLGSEIKKGGVGDALAKFKKMSQQEQEEEKRLAELKKKNPVFLAKKNALTLTK